MIQLEPSKPRHLPVASQVEPVEPVELLDARARTWLGALADALIPAEDEMPAASATDVAGAGVDSVLAARPDLIAPLKAALDAAAGIEPPARAIRWLREQHSPAFAALAEVVAGAYFLHPEIQRRVGFHGRSTIPVDSASNGTGTGTQVLADLLAPVLQRGSICRQDPRGAP